jgi:hypothetical protein
VAPLATVLLAVIATGCWQLETTQPLVLSTTVGIPVNVCEGLGPRVEWSATITFDWGDGTTNRAGYSHDAPTGHCLWHTYSSPGTYEGLVSVAPGTTGFDQRRVTVTVAPATGGYVNAGGTCACHTSATLSAPGLVATVRSFAPDDVTYGWNFGDGTTATTTTGFVQHTFPAPGTYTVGLNVFRRWYLAAGTTYHEATAWTTATVRVGS